MEQMHPEDDYRDQAQEKTTERAGTVATLNKQVAALSEEIAALSGRLEPVLESYPEAGGADMGAVPEITTPIEQVSRELDRQIARVRSLTGRVVA